MGHRDKHERVDPSGSWLNGRVSRCAWCRRATIAGGLPYYTDVYVADAGCWLAVPASPVATGTDGIWQRQAFLVRLGDALRPLADLAAIQRAVSRVLREHLGVGRVSYSEVSGPDELEVVAFDARCPSW